MFLRTTTAETAETEPDRVARHLAMLRELAELGMSLARLAAGEAERDSAAPDTEKPGEPPPRREARADFARLAQGVRQTIALERRVASGRAEPAHRPPDRRAGLVWAPLRDLAEAQLGTDTFSILRKRMTERLDEALAADPDGTQSAGEVLLAVAGRLGIVADADALPPTLQARARGGAAAGATGPP